MFQIISLVGILATVALVVRICLDLSRGDVLKVRTASRFGQIRAFVAAMTVLSAITLACSGFGGSLVTGHVLSGYLLMGHVAAGGGFIVCLAASALLWSEKCRLCACGRTDEPVCDDGQWTVSRKTFFWCFLAFGFGTALTTLISMVPLFHSDLLHILKEVHRWCALLLVMSGVGFRFTK